MKAISYGLLGLLILCLTFELGHAGQVRHEPAPDLFTAVWAPQETNSADTWAGARMPVFSSNQRPVIQVAMGNAWDYGPLLEGYRHGVGNYYGYRPFGYFGYQPETYQGYRAPGYYGYRYYYQTPAFLPGFRFRYRF